MEKPIFVLFILILILSFLPITTLALEDTTFTQDDKTMIGGTDDFFSELPDENSNISLFETTSKINGTHIRNINRADLGLVYKPLLQEVPNLTSYVARAGDYSVVYTGWYDLDFSRFGTTDMSKYDKGQTISPINHDLTDIATNIENVYVDSLASGQANYATVSPRVSNRIYEILGSDIDLIADKIILENEPSGSLSETTYRPNFDTEENVPTQNNYTLRKYYIRQAFADWSKSAKLYQIIEMMYKASDRYKYEIYSWSNARYKDNRDIPFSDSPLLQQTNWRNATLKSDNFYTDVFVSNSNPGLYWEQAIKDGLIMPALTGSDESALIEEGLPTGMGNVLNRYLEDAGVFTYPNAVPKVVTSIESANEIKYNEVIDVASSLSATAGFGTMNRELTLGELCELLKKFMILTGEPEINTLEKQQLLAAYGSYIPTHLNGSQRDAIEYMIVRGILDPCAQQGVISYSEEPVLVSEVLTMLMRMKDSASRLDFKKVALAYNPSLIEDGYALSEFKTEGAEVYDLKFTEDTMMDSYIDILLKIDSNTEVRNSAGSSRADTLYWTSKLDNNILGKDGNYIPETVEYIGVKEIDSIEYYHFQIYKDDGFGEFEQKRASFHQWITNKSQQGNNLEGLISINTTAPSDKPHSLALRADEAIQGGIFEYANSATQSDGVSTRVTFKRLGNFTERFTGFVDSNKRQVMQTSTSRVYLARTVKLVTLEMGIPTIHKSEYRWDNKSFEEMLTTDTYNWTEEVTSDSNFPQVREVSGEESTAITDNDISQIQMRFKSSSATPIIEFMEKFRVSGRVGDYSNLPAYIKGSDEIMVPFSALRSKGLLNTAAYIPGDSANGLGEEFHFTGDNNNIFIIKGFDGNLGTVRVISGNTVADYVDQTSPIALREPDSEEYLIDYRVIQGITKGYLNIKTDDGGIMKSLQYELAKDPKVREVTAQTVNSNKTSYRTLIQYPFYGSATPNSQSTPFYTKQCTPSLLLEATNPLGNYLLYQRLDRGGSKTTYLYTFKPNINSINEVRQEPSAENILDEIGAILDSDNEIAHKIDLTPFSQDRLLYKENRYYTDGADMSSIVNRIDIEFDQSSDFDVRKLKSRFYIGDYGWQMILNEPGYLPERLSPELDVFSYYNYIMTPNEWYPIPLVLMNVGGTSSPTILLDLNANCSNYLDVFGFPASLWNPNLAEANNSAYKINMDPPPSNYTNSIGISKLFSGVGGTIQNNQNNFMSSMKPAVVSVVSRYYAGRTEDGKDKYTLKSVLETGNRIILYGNMPLTVKDETQPGATEVKKNLVFEDNDGNTNTSIKLSEDLDETSINSLEHYRMIFQNNNSTFFSYEPKDLVFVNYDKTNASKSTKSLTSTNSTTSKNIYDLMEGIKNLRLNSIDDFLSFLIIFIISILPRIALVIIIALAALSLVIKYPFILAFCDRIWDPYKTFSVGYLNAHTVRPKLMWIAGFFAIILLSLLQRGVVFDIISWITSFTISLLDR